MVPPTRYYFTTDDSITGFKLLMIVFCWLCILWILSIMLKGENGSLGPFKLIGEGSFSLENLGLTHVYHGF